MTTPQEAAETVRRVNFCDICGSADEQRRIRLGEKGDFVPCPGKFHDTVTTNPQEAAETVRRYRPLGVAERFDAALDTLTSTIERAEDAREALSVEAFTSPDADWDTMLDSLRARIADLVSTIEGWEADYAKLHILTSEAQRERDEWQGSAQNSERELEEARAERDRWEAAYRALAALLLPDFESERAEVERLNDLHSAAVEYGVHVAAERDRLAQGLAKMLTLGRDANGKELPGDFLEQARAIARTALNKGDEQSL